MVCSTFAAAALYRLGDPGRRLPGCSLRPLSLRWYLTPNHCFVPQPSGPGRERVPIRWLTAAAVTGSPPLRVSGLFLIGALLVMIITDRKPAAVKLRRSALMLIPASVIMAFATYLYVLTGSWTSWYRARRPVGCAS